MVKRYVPKKGEFCAVHHSTVCCGRQGQDEPDYKAQRDELLYAAKLGLDALRGMQSDVVEARESLRAAIKKAQEKP